MADSVSAALIIAAFFALGFIVGMITLMIILSRPEDDNHRE